MTVLDIDYFLEVVRRGNTLPDYACVFVCEQLTNVLLREPNVQDVQTPITVVGDVHGQLHDVLEMFRIGGDTPFTNYLFLGDFVDRGHFSVQTISLLACLKLRFPTRVNLIRGNHESRQITQVYGFYTECCSRYGESGPSVWKAFTDMFDYLPIAALVDKRIFCTHGGLSPVIHNIDQIRVLQRFQEIPHEGAIADLMWSDPDSRGSGFSISSRGAGYMFGEDVFEKFVHCNDISYMLRAHQLCMEGYQTLFKNRFSTVWTAPDYCGRAGNKASILEISPEHEMFFNVFSACPVALRGPANFKSAIVPKYFV